MQDYPSRGEDYPWLSALSHVQGIKDRLLSEDMPLLKEIKDWSEYLSIPEEDVALKRIRDCTNTGYPAGNESFVMRLEGLVLGGKEGCLVPAGGG